MENLLGKNIFIFSLLKFICKIARIASAKFGRIFRNFKIAGTDFILLLYKYFPVLFYNGKFKKRSMAYLGADLVAALASLDVHNLPHDSVL